MTIITRHSNFSGFIGPPVLFDMLIVADFGFPVMAKINHSNLEIDGSFFWEHKFGKFGFSTIAGVGLSSYLSMETKVIDIEQFSSTFLEEIQVEGNLRPKTVTPFGKIQIGLFYDYSNWTRFFFRPTFRMDLIKVQSDLLDNQFWAIGGMLGVSWKI